MEATRKELKSLDSKLEDLQQKELTEVTAEVLNVLEGMRRDITYGKDNIKRMSRILFR